MTVFNPAQKLLIGEVEALSGMTSRSGVVLGLSSHGCGRKHCSFTLKKMPLACRENKPEQRIRYLRMNTAERFSLGWAC